MAREHDSHKGQALIRIARGSIREAFGLAPWPRATADWLAEPGATFVTLRQGDDLRGCIGSLEPRRALAEDVAANARAAAFADPRFAPLRHRELEVTSIEVSLLSPSAPLPFATAEELFAQVVPGVDGIVLEAGARRATFLPQVWDVLPHPRDFFGELARKAGLPASHPIERCRVLRYRVQKWSEVEGNEVEALR
jgi:AmmeMemoRadiSam system protein A